MNYSMSSLNFHSGQWRGFVAEGCEGDFGALDEWTAAPPGEIVVSYASRDVCRITLNSGRVAYAKIIRALTDGGLTGKDWFSWAKWHFRPSRALATWRISQKLLAAGFRCPQPLLAVRKRTRCTPTDIFVSAGISAPDLWAEFSISPEALAAELARFHRAGFAHGDCILRNICRDNATGELIYLDNDRTWRPPALFRAHYQRRNLAQLVYSLIKHENSTAAAEKFLAAYPGLSRRIHDRLLAGALQRYNRNRKNPL